MGSDILKNAALCFQSLEGKRYRIVIMRKDQTQELTLFFPTQAFHHLSGLHKLKDTPIVQRGAKNVYKEILDGKITYQDIESSAFINDIKERLYFFKQINTILQTDSLFFKSLKGYFKGITASFVMTNILTDKQYGFLFFAKDNTDYLPCSFFNRNEQKEYTRNGVRWTIQSINEI